MAVVASIATAATVADRLLKSDPIQKIKSLFGEKESAADLNKQKIQSKLSSLGYPQFSSMSGWGGDEKAKNEAMAVILAAVTNYEGAAETITGWLEGGKITPNTIDNVLDAYPVKEPAGKDPAKSTFEAAAGVSRMDTSFPSAGELIKAIPLWGWVAGALIVAAGVAGVARK